MDHNMPIGEQKGKQRDQEFKKREKNLETGSLVISNNHMLCGGVIMPVIRSRDRQAVVVSKCNRYAKIFSNQKNNLLLFFIFKWLKTNKLNTPSDTPLKKDVEDMEGGGHRAKNCQNPQHVLTVLKILWGFSGRGGQPIGGKILLRQIIMVYTGQMLMCLKSIVYEALGGNGSDKYHIGLGMGREDRLISPQGKILYAYQGSRKAGSQ